MEQTITPKFVRIAEFDRKDVNGDVVLDDNGNVIKDVKVLVRATEPVKYVTANGEDVNLNDIAFFYDGVRAQLKGEHDAAIYLGNVAQKCKVANVSFTDAMTSLLLVSSITSVSKKAKSISILSSLMMLPKLLSKKLIPRCLTFLPSYILALLLNAVELF